MKSTVYIETTIISYLAARPSRDLVIAAHQQITHEWWEAISPKMNCFISPFVLQEIEAGDEYAAKKRHEAVSHLPILPLNREIQKLAERYFNEFEIPEKARLDAAHLAIAVWYEVEYMLSWNCKHIANGRIIRSLQSLNAILGFATPIICTPEELMEI